MRAGTLPSPARKRRARWRAGGMADLIAAPTLIAVMQIRFSGFTGETVFHCHILAHEGAGMMANILVTPR